MAAQSKHTAVKLHLDAEARTLFGKKLKKFRHQGKVPANVFGPKFKSQSVTVELKDFSKTYRVAEETGIIYLKVGKEEIPVLVRDVQRHPVNNKLLHLSNIVRVEALPAEIPHEVEVDIAALKEIGNEIKVSDLPKSDKYTVKEEADKVLVSVIAHKEESLVAETAVAEPEVITEAVKEGEEGAAPETEVAEGKDAKQAAPAEKGDKGEKKEKQPEAKPPAGKKE